VRLASTLNTIQAELADALQTVHPDDASQLIEDICAAQSIFVAGMGRVGLVSRAFAMRLMHLGLSAHWIGEVTSPPAGYDRTRRSEGRAHCHHHPHP